MLTKTLLYSMVRLTFVDTPRAHSPMSRISRLLRHDFIILSCILRTPLQEVTSDTIEVQQQQCLVFSNTTSGKKPQFSTQPYEDTDIGVYHLSSSQFIICDNTDISVFNLILSQHRHWCFFHIFSDHGNTESLWLILHQEDIFVFSFLVYTSCVYFFFLFAS